MNSFNSEWLRNYELRRKIKADCDTHKRIRTHTEPKEPKSLEREVSNDKFQSPKVEEDSLGKFKVTITFLASDKRRRDLDNGASTLLDLLPAARRQLLCDFGIKSEGSKS